MYILDPGLDEDSSKALVGGSRTLMKKQGVEIQSTEPWASEGSRTDQVTGRATTS
jgi:hypothetical protein